MRFRCQNPKCESEFVYPAIKTFYEHTDDTTQEYVHPQDHIVLARTEVNVCPYCKEKSFDELTKDTKTANDNVAEVVSVPHAEVTAKIKEGFKVYGIYARETVLVKRCES